MCQQVVYDSEEYSYSEGEQISSGDEFDREEELRGYNRAIDFTESFDTYKLLFSNKQIDFILTKIVVKMWWICNL